MNEAMRAVVAGRRQCGAVAIEFAILFPLFLLLFYAIVSYSLAFVVQQGLHHLSAEVARVALSVEREANGEPNVSSIESEVAAFLATENQGVARHAALCDGEVVIQNGILEVCLRIGVGPGEGLALPKLRLIGLEVPHLDELRSTSRIRL